MTLLSLTSSKGCADCKAGSAPTILVLMACLVGQLCGLRSSMGQDARSRIARGKAATAFLSGGPGGFGASATCVSDSGLFVTVGSAVQGQTAELLLAPGEESERKVAAKVVRRDPVRDIVILQATDSAKYVALDLGDDAALRETDSLTIFGYPFGDKTQSREKFGPQLSVNICRVSALRRKANQLDEIQIDAEINPGNQGGPAIDESGKVIGLVRNGIFATGVNFVLPISHLKAALSAPVAAISLPRVTKETLLSEQVAEVRLNSVNGPIADAQLELVLTQISGKSRAIPGVQSAPGVYQFRFVAYDDAPNRSIPWIWSKVDFPGGNLTGHLLNQKIALNGETLGLESLRTLEISGATATAQLTDGRELQGALKNWPTCTLDVGGAQWNVGTDKIKRIEFSPTQITALSPVHYSAFLKQNSEITPLLTGEISPEGAARSYHSISWSFYDAEKRKELKTPARIADAFLAAGGELLLLQTVDGGVSIYDVNEADITSTLKLPAPDARLAVSLDHLFVAVPSKNLLQRYSLKTKKLELSCNLPVPAMQFAGIAIGYASQGPLLITHTEGQTTAARRKFTFLDPFTLAKLDLDMSGAAQEEGFLAGHWRIRASATGDLFCFSPTQDTPDSRVVALRVEKGRIQVSVNHDQLGYISPSYDGGLIHAYRGGFDLDLKLIPKRPRYEVVATTHQGLSLVFAEDVLYVRSKDWLPVGKTPLRQDSLRQANATGFGNTTKQGRESLELTREKRYFCIPQARQIITIPATNDGIWIDLFDLSAAAKLKGGATLYNDTPNLGVAWRGALYWRPLHYQSLSGKFDFTLNEAPAGMTISPLGELQWKTPIDFPDRFATVTMTVKDSGGEELTETLRIPVTGGN